MFAYWMSEGISKHSDNVGNNQTLTIKDIHNTIVGNLLVAMSGGIGHTQASDVQGFYTVPLVKATDYMKQHILP